MKEQLDLMNKYGLKEIRTRIDDYMRCMEITFYSKNNKCIRRLIPLENITEMNRMYFTVLFQNMGKEVKADADSD